jgi:hypothetical protein
MTALTQHRLPDSEHAIVGRSVWIVARRAVLSNGRVLPEYWPSHLGVTAHAALTNRAACTQRLDVADRSVGVVTGRARHLSLAYRHVRDRALRLGDLHPVAPGAELRFGGFDKLVLGGSGRVHAVTRRAGQVARLVHAALPSGVRAAVMARETSRTRLGRLHRRDADHVAFGIIIHVSLTWPMTAFATAGGGGGARVGRLAVRSAPKTGLLLFVTEHARIAACIAGRLRRSARLRLCGLRGGARNRGSERCLQATASSQHGDRDAPDKEDTAKPA